MRILLSAFLISLTFHASLPAYAQIIGVEEALSRCSGPDCTQDVRSNLRTEFCRIASGSGSGMSGKGRNSGCSMVVPPFKDEASAPAGRQYCENLRDDAARCCGANPDPSCSSGLDLNDPGSAGGGVAKGAATDGANNARGAQLARGIRGRCLARAGACKLACDKIEQGFKSINPASEIVKQAMTSVKSMSATCNSMKGSAAKDAENEYEQGKAGSGQTEQAANTGGGAGGAGSGGGGFDPSSLMKMLQGMGGGEKPPEEPFQSQSCEENPWLAGCDICKTQPTLPQCLNSENWEKGMAGAARNEDTTNANDFNVGNDSPIGSQSVEDRERTPAPPVTNATIANGGGGMAGGAGGGQAQLGAQGAGGGAGAKTNTDVLRGERGGGGGGMAAMNAGMRLESGNQGGFGGYGGGKEPPKMDLSQFLPGGAKDPTRRLAGQGSENVQINSPQVNIWNRISERLKARCSAGRLKDCGP